MTWCDRKRKPCLIMQAKFKVVSFLYPWLRKIRPVSIHVIKPNICLVYPLSHYHCVYTFLATILYVRTQSDKTSNYSIGFLTQYMVSVDLVVKSIDATLLISKLSCGMRFVLFSVTVTNSIMENRGCSEVQYQCEVVERAQNRNFINWNIIPVQTASLQNTVCTDGNFFLTAKMNHGKNAW